MSEEDGGQQRSDRADEAEEMARLQEQINNLPVGEHVLYMMHSLSALAVDRLGLSAEGAARRDVEQARLAIEAFRALLGVLEQARPTEEIAAHRAVLSQLQLAYAGALGSAAPPEEGAASPSDETKEAAPETAEEATPSDQATADEGVAPGEAAPRQKTQKKTTNKPGKASKPRSSTGGGAKKSSSASTHKGEKKDS